MYTAAEVRAALYDYPELRAEYRVGYGSPKPGQSGGGGSGYGPGRPVEREAIRLAALAEKLDWYKGLLTTLTPTEYILVRCRYFENMPYTTIGRTVGAAASTVHKRDRQIIQKLRDHINALALSA